MKKAFKSMYSYVGSSIWGQQESSQQPNHNNLMFQNEQLGDKDSNI